MKVPLLDITRQVTPMRSEIDRALDRVVTETKFILGPQVKEFETSIAHYCDVKHAVGVASGTDALVIALQAMGIRRGHEVITTPYSFYATASSIWRIGARPVFVDIDPLTYNIDPKLISEVITDRTKAILAVHLFGQCADMDSLQIESRGVPVVEDAAQAIGATWKGVRAGKLGIMGCFSFFPSKNLGGFGDAGMIVTDDASLAERSTALRVHGARETYFHDEVGYNSRLDTIQAAILDVKLKYLESWHEGRRRNAAYYNEAFKNSRIVTPACRPEAGHIYNQYVIRVPNRDELKTKLQEAGIGTAIYYPLPLHLQPCFSELEYHLGDFPEAERASRETLALPIFAELTRSELEYVVDTVLTIAG